MAYGLSNGRVTGDVTPRDPKGAVRQYGRAGYPSDSLAYCLKLIINSMLSFSCFYEIFVFFCFF